jgi:hypothetical protein
MTKYSTVLAMASLATLLALCAPNPGARADIFQWEYINPAIPSLGKQPSTTLALDGAGAIIGASLPAYWVDGGEWSPGYFVNSDLSGTNLSQADLTNADLSGSLMYGAILTGAEVRGTRFAWSLSAAQ